MSKSSHCECECTEKTSSDAADTLIGVFSVGIINALK